MDHSLLFHVGRLKDFIGEPRPEEPFREHKNTLRLQYLDNLNKIVEQLREDGLGGIKSNHGLVDWACLAEKIIKDLGYDEDYNINQIFERMETEKSSLYPQRQRTLSNNQKSKSCRNINTQRVDLRLPALRRASRC